MTDCRRDYYFTHHLRERFLQRSQKIYKHLQNCRKDTCKTCESLKRHIKIRTMTERRQIDAEISRRINAAKENRSYINNSGFMQWYYDKYGYEKRFQFLIHEDLLFIVVIDQGKKVVVTCVAAKTHLAGKNALRPKFKKS